MKKVRAWIYNFILYSNAVVLFFMFLILLVQVIYRKFLNDPLSWSEEIALLSMIWVTFVGAYQCTAEDSHLKMSFLENALPKTASIIFKVITKLIIIAFLIIAAVAGIPLLESSVSKTLPITGLTMLLPYAIIWGSIALMLLETIIQIIVEIMDFLNPKKSDESNTSEEGSSI
ncbi:TRAP transporter small permease [Salinicoccus sp. Marseille-QA3877]